MRTTKHAAARAGALAVFFLAVIGLSGTVAAEESILTVQQTLTKGDSTLAVSGEVIESATLELVLEAWDLADGYPIDCVLVIDTSSTSEANLLVAKAFALDVIDQLGGDDRVALVSFSTAAQLDIALTSKHTNVKSAVANLSAGGKSAFGEALQEARMELIEYGRDDAIHVEILLCDGQSNSGAEPDIEGEIAADAGIIMISVGIGNLINENLLEAFAEQTDGLFFSRPSDDALAQIADHLRFDVAATSISVEKFLPLGLELVDADPSPTSISSVATGTLVTWRVSQMLLGEQRVFEVTIQTDDTEAWKAADTRSEIVYVDFRGGSHTIDLPALIPAENDDPVAGFSVLESEIQSGASDVVAHVGTAVVFDASESYDVDGAIDRYEWDFDGDGIVDLSSDFPEAEFVYDEPGTYEVTLTVTDDHWARATVRLTVDVVSGIDVVRTIETCLPDDRTAAGAVLTVSIEISAFDTVNGLSVTELIPDGWTFTAVSNDGATLRESGSMIEWIFLEKLVESGRDTKREIAYTLTAPASAPSADTPATIQGWIGSSAPRLSLPIAGEDRITLACTLSIPVVVSRWDVENDVLDLCLQELVSFKQVQYAVSLWLSGEEVPYTGGLTVTLSDLQDLIAFWLTASSVHDPLP